MSTLIATYTSAAGGSERLLLDVANGLDEPPLIACPAGWLAVEARRSGFTVLELPERSLHVRRSARDRVASAVRMGAHARELRRLCADLRPELFVAWGMRTGIAAASAFPGLGDAPPWILQHNDFLPGPAIGRAVRAAAARAERVVCITRAVAADLDPGGALADRIEVIHCGVDTDRFTPAAAGNASGAVDAADVLFLGAIVPWKRPDLALEIAALAVRSAPALRLRVAGAPLEGDGDELLASLRRRAAEPDLSGHVEFAGRVEDPVAALRGSACLLHCSDREPFGLVLAEALACGTPVVAPAAGGPAEIVDATCGALYPAGDAGAGAAALVQVLRERAALTDAARRRAESAFSLPVMHARYRALVAATSRADDATMPKADVTFVTVSYNSAPELERLAASIDQHASGSKLIVVDNASADDSRTVAERAGAQLIELGQNYGFGVAANAGVAAARSAVTILVNPDVELVDGSLLHLAQQAAPGRLLAPLLLDPDGSRQDSAHPRPASAATAFYALVPGALLPQRLRRRVEPWRSRQPRRVGWATAACLVAETETLRALGPFDDSIFLYAEDLDLGLRAETWFHPEARVVHTRAHSSAREFGGENYELLARQRRDVVRRRGGRLRAALDDVIELTTFADRALLRRLFGRSAQRERRRFRARVEAMRKR